MLKFICVFVLLFSSACGKKSNLVNEEYEAAKRTRYKNDIEGYNIENSKYDNFNFAEEVNENKAVEKNIATKPPKKEITKNATPAK